MSNKTKNLKKTLSLYWVKPMTLQASRVSAFLVALFLLLAVSIRADTTVTITNPIPLIFGGAGVTGVYPGYTNSQVAFTLAGDTNVVSLYVNVVGNPVGVTAGFVTNANPNSAANINAVINTTNSLNAYLSVSVVSASKGNYPLEIIASNNFNGLMVTNSSTLLVLPNVFTAGSSPADTNWSTAANWSAGAPVEGDSVRFQYTNNAATNAYFNTSIVLNSLELMPKVSALTVTNYFASGVTVAVNGTNGFWAGVDANTIGTLNNFLFNFSLIGAGALVVTNSEAPFSMYSHIWNNNVGAKQDLSGLDNLYVDVKRFGLGDGFLIYPKITGNQPAEMGLYLLAKTNFIRATYVGDYSGERLMTNSIMFFNSAGNATGTGNPYVYLGISNGIYADSISAFSQASGVDTAVVKFNPAFTNGYAPVAVFRGTNGGRMSYFGAGVESGSVAGSRTRGQGFDFAGGKLDMQVDKIELARVSTNRNDNYAQGYLKFYYGNVNANSIKIGYKPTTAFVPAIPPGLRGELWVGGAGSNAVLTVNGTLGFTVQNYLTTAQNTYGRLVIGNGGIVYANTIECGYGSSSYITVQTNGQLFVSNTLASAAAPMPTLTVNNGGKLNLSPTVGTTNAFVTNLTDSAGAKINILSLSGFSPTVPATNVLIHYENATGAGSHPISIGTIPAGYNNVSIYDNAADKNIELRIATNTPATLIWKGYVNNVWDRSTPNWFNPVNNSQVAFFNSDTVVFAETNSPLFKTISITEEVIPAGIYMSNTASAYAFEGAGSIGGCPMTKEGTASFTNSANNGAVVQFKGGALYGAGTLGGLTLYTNTAMNYGGSVTAGLTINDGGLATLLSGGFLNGQLSVSGGAVFTNQGTVQGGSMTISSNGLVINALGGVLANVGNNATISGTLVNIGNIGAENQANTITVNGTFKDMGLGSIYLTTLTFNSGSTFLPGGDGIGSTEIKSALTGSSYPGRLTLLTGSTTLVKVDLANPQTNTLVLAQFTDFGGNTAVKSYDGGTVLMTNINSGAGSFALNQIFRVFTGPSGSDIGNEGLNTTNRYPIVIPIIPAVNTKWGLTSLRDTSPNGILNIAGYPTTGTNITSTTYQDGTNMVTHLQWPADYIGWRLLQQTNSLTVGLYTNWTTVPGSAQTNDISITNSMQIDTSFYKMVYP